MPPEDRLRRDQRCDLREQSASQALTHDGETPTLAVTQLQPPTAQLSLENPVLLAQEFNHVPLLLFEPSEERRDKEMQRNHDASLRHCLVDPVLRHYGRGANSFDGVAPRAGLEPATLRLTVVARMFN